MELEFKKAEEEDWETILSLEKSVSDNPYYFAMTKKEDIKNYIKKSNVFIIQKQEKSIGTISYEIKDENHIYLDGLNIHPDNQKQGIATKAMEFIMDKLKNTKKLSLHVHPKNTAAIKLCLNFGFNIESWVNDHFRDGEPRLILIKGN